MKKVIIVDDERASRALIKEFLSDFPEFVVVCESKNGLDAVRDINNHEPELVFLDIQMPGLTGFEVLTQLNYLPKIIFSTAYDKYAIKAFDVHAIDYLLKPYNQERFGLAIDKLNNLSNNPVESLTESLLDEENFYPKRVLVNQNRKLITLKTDRITWVEAYGDYSKIHCENEVFLSNRGISILEEKLDPQNFIRIHRSSIININEVKELHKYGKSYDVTMNNGNKIRASKGYLDNLKKLIL